MNGYGNTVALVRSKRKKLTVPWLSMEGNFINGKWMCI